MAKTSGSLNPEKLKLLNTLSNIQIAFIKKTSSFTAYNAGMGQSATATFLNWLQEAKNALLQAGSIEEYDPTIDRDVAYFSLDQKPTWLKIKDLAFSTEPQITARNSKDLAGVNHSYLVYAKSPESIFARMNKITPSYILNKGGFFLTDTFKKVQEEAGVKLEREADLAIHYDLAEDRAIAWIWHGTRFESMFDVVEHQVETAQAFINKELATLVDEEILKSVILEDRNLTKMLNKPIIQAGNFNTDIQYIKDVKAKAPELAIEIKRNKLIIPEDAKEKKKAIKDLLKVIAYHITRTLDDAHILEGNPIRVVS